jgi:hypothetical protein
MKEVLVASAMTYLVIALFTTVYSFFGLKLDILTSLRNGVCSLIIPISTTRSESQNRRREYFITITDIDNKYPQIMVSVTGTKEEVESGGHVSIKWINDTFRRMMMIENAMIIRGASELNLHWKIYDGAEIPKYRTRRCKWKIR